MVRQTGMLNLYERSLTSTRLAHIYSTDGSDAVQEGAKKEKWEAIQYLIPPNAAIRCPTRCYKTFDSPFNIQLSRLPCSFEVVFADRGRLWTHGRLGLT